MPACWKCGFESERAFKFCPECGAEPTAEAPVHEQRKTVTVLFCDLTGSTALGETIDPEALRALLARYFERMKTIVERHGGTVEKFIGDAVMAVFGVPVLHEDDALRAVRAASQMREALPDLGLEGRIGVMTGEVVTGTQERLATGDAVNVAARLEQAARPGEVLIGEATLALVRDAAEVEPIEPLELKGKAERVPAYRLLLVHDAPERRHGELFVGRERELAILQQAWERVRAEHRCELVTVVGDAGVGKSRLVAEFLASTEARVLRGRCPPYGEGITYWPVVEVLKRVDVLPPEGAAAAAIRSLLGESEAATSAEEIAWAFRKTLEHGAEQRPLAVVFDDIQWGEETFLDLVEHVALLSSNASILVICIARPELGEHRPAWPVTLRLEPLRQEAVEELIPGRVPGELRERIARAAGGNPLFIQEMLAIAGEASGEVVVPPTLRALLAARLDQLETAERSVLERGSIEGEIFHRGAVQALAPDETPVTPRLAALVRKELIRPNPSALAGEDGFRFRHLLIRDAAYDALPKAMRAELHVRFATWLQDHGTDLVELDEILGYHLEQACRYRAELGLADSDGLAATARLRLSAAGHRAQLRADYGAAASLLERATSLLPEDEIDLALETDIVDALYWGGKGPEAIQRAEALADHAATVGDHVAELSGRVQAGVIRSFLQPESQPELESLIQKAMPVFQAAGSDVALYTGHQARGWITFDHAQVDTALEAFERAVEHARRAGLPDTLLGWRAIFRLYGTTPVPEILAWLDANEPEAGRDHWCLASRALVLSMLGRFDEARRILAKARTDMADRGGGPQLGTITGIESATVELLAGDPGAAAELGAEGCRMLEQLGENGFLSSAAAVLARSLYALDRLQEADVWAARSAELGGSGDAFTQMAWRQVRARLVARRGDFGEGERLAREAIAIGDETDDLNGQGEAYRSLADVLLLAGRHGEATVALEQALERYERKGNLVSAEGARTRLAELRDEAPR